MNSIKQVGTMPELDGFESRKHRSLRTQPKTQHPDPLTCPRCESTNTKFCYYNNYNKTQPRYFCKTCKRHWTKGGVLRNVPLGGGRKNNRIRRLVMTATDSTTDQETYDVESKSSFLTPISGEKEDTESYTDIEELKGFVSWDFHETFVGCTMSEFAHEDLPFSRFSSFFDANPAGSYIPRSFIRMVENDDDLTTATSMIMSGSQQTSNLSWNDLNTMVLEDLNQPWEDPTFKT